MESRFADVKDKIEFSSMENDILKYWEDIDAFQTSLKLSEGKPEFTFYDGPPFATGKPHYGHILAGTIKDTVTRYAHQTGHYVSRRFGWDCHGLPVEFEIDKKLKITGREDVMKMGVDKYNDECRAIVQRYTGEWRKTVTRLGRWIDFDNDYKTMDPNFMESVWWVFSQLYEKGLVYRGWKVMPYSMTCGTPLSNFEAGLNYKEVSDPAATVTFPLIDSPDVSFVAWTTTPWTLPSNLALCVNPEYDYIQIKDKTRNNQLFIILEKRLSQILPAINKKDITDEKRAEMYEIVKRYKGRDLMGLKYKPLFNYFVDECPNAFRVLGDSYVTEEGGTGIVHQAPAFGEDDNRICVANGVVGKTDMPCPVDANGRFTDQVPDWKGINVKDADNDICATLKANGRLLLKESYVHSYPFCWRSDTPLIYKAVPSWFVSVETIKDRLVANNDQTYWVPAFVQEKRFHNWLRDARDWAISRNRFWGTPIPLWASDDMEEIVVIGSVEQLYELSGVKVDDLHKHHVDKITIPSKQGKGELKRIEEVFDCWFESGSMPYAQQHYPFENKERFENGFPADFIAEGLDQTRGWFYTLMVLSTALFDKPAFKNLVCNGLVLAEDGKKMSKSLKNYPDPNIVIESNSADSLRLYLINSPVVRAESLKFTEVGVKEVVRGVLLPWYNVYRFFIQCVEIYENKTLKRFTPDVNIAISSTNNVDIWILAASSGLVEYVHQEMKAYRLYTVVPRLVSFIEELTNWYVRLNRDRIKGASGASGNDANQEQLHGLNVLFEVLMTMTQIMCPFTPFFAEYLYQGLRKLLPLYNNTDPNVPEDAMGKAKSVHYLMLPEIDNSRLNPLAVRRFTILQQAVQQARVSRERRKIRSNLPLKNVLVICANQEDIDALEFLKSYFLSEINAWNVTLSTDFKTNCSLKIVPNFRELGKRLGKDLKIVKIAIESLSQKEISDFKDNGSITIHGHTFNNDDLVTKIDFNGDNKQYEASVSDDGSLMVAIDTTCDDEIMNELRAKQFGATVQKLRKSSGLVVGDKVEIFYSSKDTNDINIISESLNIHKDTVIGRLKSLPLNANKYMSNGAIVIAKETIKDDDISKKPFVLYLTQPIVAVDIDSIKYELGIQGDSDSDSNNEEQQKINSTIQYMQTLAISSITDSTSVSVTVDNTKLVLKKGMHYYENSQDMYNAHNK
jgi:isoleucyl-tRNA synthetase